MAGFERSRLSVFLAGLVTLATFLAPSRAWAAPEPGREGIVGTWLTAKADSKVSIYPCGTDAFCGRLVWIKDSVDAAGKTYRCKAELAGPDRLSLRGFVGISLLGRSEIWTRVP
jgi:uncharacterized protein (DUF2147 family)